MQTPYGHLTYCSNIHAGESWMDHFAQLDKYIPRIKQQVAPAQPFGIGLRLSNTASQELSGKENLEKFQQWLKEHDCYVFTMNGFPYGSFHHTRVKDQVHAPDWTTNDRLQYTIRMAHLLSALLPEGMDGGISTSPLTYQFWHDEKDLENIYKQTTANILLLVKELIDIKERTGKLLHLDIEPEPDGLLGESEAFFEWYTNYLLPQGQVLLENELGFSEGKSAKAIKDHVQLCYDICHFAVGYEDHASALQKLRSLGIKTGKIQVSAALKAALSNNSKERGAVIEAFNNLNEPTYLHQVVAMQKEGTLKRYRDIPGALQDAADPLTTEWRAHFHVPLFIEHYGLLGSTQKDIKQVIQYQKQQPFTAHLEIETYTWEVLPGEMRLPIDESITREIQWVLDLLNHTYHE